MNLKYNLIEVDYLKISKLESQNLYLGTET